MASLDVESLFTNIPLEETITIVTEKIFNQKRKVNGIYKGDFRQLLRMATKGTVFYFNGNYYRQKDGVAMGSPLGPDMANAVLCHHEKAWIDDCPLSYAPIFYARYVDDIFVLIRSNEHISLLANYFSSKHPNISFTYEIEKDNVLPFLDVNVYREEDKFSSTVHRKDTFSGVYTNFQSFLPETYKRGLISTLLYRAWMISSSFHSLHAEIENLKKIFTKNGYPSKVVDRCIFLFFNKLYEKRLPVHTVPKKEFVMVVPFLGTTSWKVKNSLIRSFRKIVPFSSLKVIFKTNTKLSSCFTFKDKLPKSLLSGVIYRFTCSGCNLRYIGCTKRYWEKRLEEHSHISARTGKPMNGSQVFAPLQHVKSDACCPAKSVKREDFTIIGYESDSYLLQVKESIFISTERPQLNNRVTSVPLHLFVP